MDILKTVLGGLASATQSGGSNAAPAAGGAAAIAALMPVLLKWLGSSGGGANGGGLAALVEQLGKGGLGDVVQSWIGTGRNLPVSGDQLGAALGDAQLGSLGKAAGIDVSQLTPLLAQVLPGLVDQLTPQGRLPAAGEAGPDLGSLLGSLLR